MLIGVATPQMVCTWQIQAVHILYTLGLQSPLTCHIDILSVSYKYNNLLATHTTPVDVFQLYLILQLHFHKAINVHKK